MPSLLGYLGGKEEEKVEEEEEEDGRKGWKEGRRGGEGRGGEGKGRVGPEGRGGPKGGGEVQPLVRCLSGRTLTWPMH